MIRRIITNIKNICWAPKTLLVTLLPIAAGCTPDAIDLELSVDPSISTADELASQVGSLVLILDHPNGLYTSDQATSQGNTQVKNADSDPGFELVTTLSLTEPQLPSIRIERGGIDESGVDVRVLGLKKNGTQTIAQGLARGLTFARGGEPWNLPFNFLDDERPPRVRDTVPHTGMNLPGCALASLSVVFSRPMDEASLKAGSVTVGSAITTTVKVVTSASGLVADVLFSPPLEGNGTTLTFDLTISTGALGDDGTPLDQAGSVKGNQPFSTQIELPCGPPPTEPCTIDSCQWLCGDHECLHLPTIACVEGVCTPVACSVDCTPGEVCSPLLNACVPDCRTADSISACASGECNSQTGLCN
ncbi:MAG: hypothetical protein IPK82_14435 [Polyangiaceae bacterium]|nr:hypothetical protein [Polyangiaceae bacterium]